MAQKYKLKNTLRNLPFYSEEMNNTEKTAKFPNTNFLSELPFFPKTTKQFFTGHNCINKIIKWIFVQQEKIKQIIKEHFNKKLTMTIDDEKKKNNNDSEIFGYAMKN